MRHKQCTGRELEAAAGRCNGRPRASLLLMLPALQQGQDGGRGGVASLCGQARDGVWREGPVGAGASPAAAHGCHPGSGARVLQLPKSAIARQGKTHEKPARITELAGGRPLAVTIASCPAASELEAAPAMRRQRCPRTCAWRPVGRPARWQARHTQKGTREEGGGAPRRAHATVHTHRTRGADKSRASAVAAREHRAKSAQLSRRASPEQTSRAVFDA